MLFSKLVQCVENDIVQNMYNYIAEDCGGTIALPKVLENVNLLYLTW